MEEETDLQEEKNVTETVGPRPLSAFLFAQNSVQTPSREQTSHPDSLFVSQPQTNRTYTTPIHRPSPCERIDYPFYDQECDDSEEEFFPVEEVAQASPQISRDSSYREQPSLSVSSSPLSHAQEEKAPSKVEPTRASHIPTVSTPFFSFPLEMTTGGEVLGIYRRYLELIRHKEQIQKLQSAPLPPLVPNDSAKSVETLSKENASDEDSPLTRIEQIQKILTVLPDASKETLRDLLQQLNLTPTGLKNNLF